MCWAIPMIHGSLGDVCISDQSDWRYYDQPIQLVDWSNCHFQQYLLTSAKLALARWRRKQMSFRIVSPRIVIMGKCVFGFLLWKYKQKSLKATKHHLELELASIFLMANWRITAWIIDKSLVSLSTHQVVPVLLHSGLALRKLKLDQNLINQPRNHNLQHTLTCHQGFKYLEQVLQDL